MRLTVSLGVSSLAVWLLGPVVKTSSFATLFLVMAAIAAITATVVPAVARRPDDEARAGCRDLSGAAQRAAGRVDCPASCSRGEERRWTR